MDGPISRGDLHGYLAEMIPRHDATYEAISEHFYPSDYVDGSEFDYQEPITGPLAVYENLPVVHPSARVASILYEGQRRQDADEKQIERQIQLVESVVRDAVAGKQWTTEMPWKSGGRTMRIGQMEDRHLANSIAYCRRGRMWRSMAALMIEQSRRKADDEAGYAAAF